MIDSLLLVATRVFTFVQQQLLTNASGFFFERDGRLFLVTSRHVVIDEANRHTPDRLEIELHVDPNDLAKSHVLDSVVSRWRRRVAPGRGRGRSDRCRRGRDRARRPARVRGLSRFHAATSVQRERADQRRNVAAGRRLPARLSRHAAPHAGRAPCGDRIVVRMRFQGQGCFLTDARTHRGTSGAPVVMRMSSPSTPDDLPWKLLGVHSAASTSARATSISTKRWD